MRVVVINTGSELLLGDVVNSDLAFIAREIFALGLRVERQVAVPDGSPIRIALEEESRRAEIIFVTGGLGPTTDDLTREITAEFLGLELRHDPAVMAAISARASNRGFKLTERTSRQADVPEGATVLPNAYGSAPGLYLGPRNSGSKRSPHIFLLPGPPRELHPMYKESVLPILRGIVPAQPKTNRRIYRISGMGESLVEEAVGQTLIDLGEIEIGYCARPGEVDLRVIGVSTLVEKADAIIKARLGEKIFSFDSESLEEVVVKLLTREAKTVAVAESCTGGYLANRLTNVPGASAVFLAGYVTYANEAKAKILSVDSHLISEHGAVSEPVARAMAEGARRQANATFGLSTTGIAGPSGGSEEKPVGTVFIGLATQKTTQVNKFRFPDDRPTFKELATQAALEMLRRSLLSART